MTDLEVVTLFAKPVTDYKKAYHREYGKAYRAKKKQMKAISSFANLVSQRITAIQVAF